MVNDQILADTVETTWMRHTSTSHPAWHVQTEIDCLLTNITHISLLAVTSVRVTSQINACSVISAWVVLAHAGLFQWTFDRASFQLLVPEEHIGALGHDEAPFAGALKEDVTFLAFEGVELFAGFQIG